MYILISTTWIVSTFSRIIIAGQDNASMDYGDTGNLLRIYAGTDTRISSICIGAFVALLTREGAKPNKLIRVITKYPITALIVSQTLLVMSLLIRDQFFRDTLRYSIQEAAIFLAITTGPVINSWPTFLQFISRMRSVKNIATASY